SGRVWRLIAGLRGKGPGDHSRRARRLQAGAEFGRAPATMLCMVSSPASPGRNRASVLFCKASSEEPLFFEPLVHIGDEFAIAVPHQGRAALIGAEDALRCLAPARMRYLGVHIGPEAVLARLQRLPVGSR